MDADMMTLASKARRETSTPSSSLARYLTRKEAAAELRIPLATLDRVIAGGKLKARKHGRATVVMRREIERILRTGPT